MAKDKDKKKKKKKKKEGEEDGAVAAPVANKKHQRAADRPTPPGRYSWALEAIDANREGDAPRLIAALRREDANVNTQTAGGGYGGFRYVTWGKVGAANGKHCNKW